MAGAKGVRKGDLRGPVGVKGAKGGLFSNHCVLLAKVTTFCFDLHSKIPKKVAYFCCTAVYFVI